MMRSALIVVNYGSSPLLERNLARENFHAHGTQVIVVDNFTSHPERNVLRALGEEHGWITVFLDSNRGFGGGVNAGVQRAIAQGIPVVAVLNPDAHISVADLERLVEEVTKDNRLMVAPIVHTGSGEVWFDGSFLYLNSGRVAGRRRRKIPNGPRVQWISGACFALSVELWNDVGGFDDDYFLYWEDVDLSFRVTAKGGRLSVLDDVRAVHDPGGTQVASATRGGKSELFYFYNIRNRLIFCAKHIRGWRRLCWIAATPVVSYEMLLTNGRRELLRSTVFVRAYVRGILAGIAELTRRHRRPGK